MNVILILIDSLNRGDLEAYGANEVRTPNLKGFAERGRRFDNHFVGSLPCMPARREIFSGFKELMWRPWGPLEPADRRLPRILEAAGYTTAIVTDHYHYWEEPGNGHIQCFQGAELVRGHELDFWAPPVPEADELPAWVRNVERWRPGAGRQYYANVREFQAEEDFFPAKVMRGAGDWLREHAGAQPFFLQVESFDVHEPFHAPEPYASMYGDGSQRDRFTLWPPYQDPTRLAEFMRTTSEEELAFIRSQYAGKLTMVDRWFGELLRTLDELALWEDTAVIVTTDHGHDLGQRGVFGKQYPHYDSHANIPLLAWHPRQEGEGSTDALTSTVDLFSTVLEVAGVDPPQGTHSHSFLPVLTGERTTHRDVTLYGTFGQGACITDGEWTLIKSPEADAPLFFYSTLLFQSLLDDRLAEPVALDRFIPGMSYPQLKVPIRSHPLTSTDFLFHRRRDPDQERNLWEEEPDQRRRMLELLRKTIASEGAPEEQFVRLGLSA